MLLYMRFKLGNSTIKYICDTQHLNIISIISYFDIYILFFGHSYHCTIYAIILISLHRTAGPFTLSFSCYPQYDFHSQYSYNGDYFCSLFDSIAYFANSTGEHLVFLIAIHT